MMGLSDRKGSEGGFAMDSKTKDASMLGAAGAGGNSGRKEAQKSDHDAKQGQPQALKQPL